MAEEGVVKGLAPATEVVDGKGLRIGVIRTRWNDKIIEALRTGCNEEMKKMGVTDIVEHQVAGAFELPFAAKTLIENSPDLDAVVCIGCLIKGDTMHFEYICEATSQGIMRVGLDTGVPVIFGVLTCLSDDQALCRAGLPSKTGKMHNHGPDWGATAVEMAALKKKLPAA